ncbi:MAG: glycosyltransferase family 39 protein, partial [Thermodesulfobacteriota bacterium]
MTALKSAPSDDRWRGRFLLCAILAVAATLRFWRLETPSLWFDEALVAMVAKLPRESIFTRAFTEDFHPPGFYLLAKAAMLMGMSNAALRIPELAFGLAGVWFAWKAGREMLSESGGLALAALTAVQPWHILLSRQLRPYSIIFLFSLASLYFLWRALRDGKARDFILAGLSLWPPLLLHFSGMLAAGGAGVAALGALLARRVKPGHFILFCIACGLGMALTLPFLSSMFGRESIAGSITRLEALATTLNKLNELMFRSQYPGIRSGLLCVAAAGLCATFVRSRLLALVSLGWVLPPLVVLAGVRYSTYFNAWHLIFLLPPILLWQVQAARALLGDRLLAWAALAMAVAGAWWHLGPDSPRYYEPSSYSGNYSEQARGIAGTHAPGTAYVYPESAVSGPLNWYLDRFTDPNPLRAQRLGPEDA